MSPRPDVSEARKNQILDAATNVFIRQGLHKARVDDIADEANLSKGAVYWYFKSRDEIIIAILDRLFEREFRGLRELQSDDRPALERLEYFVYLTIEDIQEWMRLLPIAYEFLGLVARKKIVQQSFRKYFQTYTEHLTIIMQQGIENGEIHPYDAKDAAITLGAIIEGTILLSIYDSNTVDIPKHIKTGTQIYLDGLKVR